MHDLKEVLDVPFEGPQLVDARNELLQSEYLDVRSLEADGGNFDDVWVVLLYTLPLNCTIAILENLSVEEAVALFEQALVLLPIGKFWRTRD